MSGIITQMPLSPGTILSGNYQIIRVIGKGGMGSVYMAYDASLDIKVAIKVISPGVLGNMEPSEYEIALKRFQAEARIVAQIDHPNVIRIYGFKHDLIDYQGNSCAVDYLVMELMAERTLRDTMDESGFEFEEEVKTWILNYMTPILEGLEKVHNSGIVHRDIKPENIFTKEKSVKLADFGLSMGFDFPSVTGSMIEIFGTLTYMAPEQYNNFSLARESADIFAIGRILFEAVEGRITEKITPFKQVQLSNTTTEYYRALNKLIMAATAENPAERISSARELRYRLTEINGVAVNVPPLRNRARKPRWNALYVKVLLAALAIVSGGLVTKLYVDLKYTGMPVEPLKNIEVQQSISNHLEYDVLPKGLKPVISAEENSILRLVPSLELELDAENPFGEKRVSLEAFYLSESPVTNEQYVDFLNKNLERLELSDSDILMDKHLLLKLSEKIRGYKPIVFDGERYNVSDPMHSSCAVLMVTGYGADAYARFFGFRLVTAREWYALMVSNNVEANPILSLPTPVINYPQKKFGLRGINQIAEWGRAEGGAFMILGKAVSSMVGNSVIEKKDAQKYYTDTSFRIARDVVSGQVGSELEQAPEKQGPL